jgi:hypothetical protein
VHVLIVLMVPHCPIHMARNSYVSYGKVLAMETPHPTSVGS